METKEISETSVFSSTLTRLMAREDFSTFILHERFKSYIMCLLFDSNERQLTETVKLSCN
jgi:hypothetical protein